MRLEAALTQLPLHLTAEPKPHTFPSSVLLKAATTRLLLLSTYRPTAHVVLTAAFLLEAATTRLLLLSTYWPTA
jgi:hypothetical protein